MDTHTWKETYLLAISEQDITRQPQRITDARSAIFDRIEDMVKKPSSEEQRMLNDALDSLRVLQQECARPTRKKAS
jgi:hypothetical protein